LVETEWDAGATDSGSGGGDCVYRAAEPAGLCGLAPPVTGLGDLCEKGERTVKGKLGWLGEKLCLGFGLLFSGVVLVQTFLTACRGGGYVLFFAVGALGMGALVLLGLRFLKPAKAYPLALCSLRFLIALGVILVFGAQP